MPEKKEKQKLVCVRGMSVEGKYSAIYMGDETITVNKISTGLIILSFVLFALAMFFASMLFPFFWIRLSFPIIGGIAGYILATKFLKGKKYKTFKYYDLSCFISARADFTIITGSNAMFTIRGLPRKQEKFLTAFEDDIAKTGKYKLLQKGDKFIVENTEDLTTDRK